jgi:hypothetical protein
VSGFIQVFGFSGDDDDEESPESTRPRWFGPPDDELGAVVPQGIVIARAERAAVALSHAVVYSTGVTFEFLARARGLTRSDASRVFHDQHALDRDDLPDAFLRIGFEFADGRRVSNLDGRRAHRRLMNPDAEPEEPLLLPFGGGGGQSGAGDVTMKPGYWLWPLPPPGPVRVSTEWPLVEVTLATVELDGRRLLDAVQQVRRLEP